MVRDDVSQRSALRNSFARKPSDRNVIKNLHQTGQPELLGAALLSVVPENPTFGATEIKGKDLS